MLLQLAVVATWAGAAVALAGLLSIVFDYGNAFGVMTVAMSLAGLLAPIAVRMQTTIKRDLSVRRLRLAVGLHGLIDHLPPRLRDLVIETRMVHSAVDSRVDRGQASRAIWDWVRQVDGLEEEDRIVLDGLGLSASPVREAVFADLGRVERWTGGLTDSQQLKVSRHLERFESTLTAARSTPYR